MSVFLFGSFATSLSQSVDSFNPAPDNLVSTLTVQPDGRILVAGNFATLTGQPSSNFGRLNGDGSFDNAFNPNVAGTVLCIANQLDGKIVIGGTVSVLGGQTCTNIGRLNPNGTVDSSFNPGANGIVRCLAIQQDGKILVGGTFTTLGGQTRGCIGRLNLDGSIDTSFNPNANNYVYSLAVQPDGKILVGGLFSQVGGQSRMYVARLNANGTVDGSFNPGADNTVISLAVQPDGKILVGGYFAVLGGQTRNYLGRLNTNGLLDTTFTNLAIGPIASNDGVFSLALQTDGKILAGGWFNTVGGLTRYGLVRLNADGTVETTFDADASFTVNALAIQPDGKILAGGQFGTLAGQTRQYLARLNNTTLATQSLSCNGSTITWERGGSSPEVSVTTFDVCTNGGDWANLGAGVRISGGWQLNSGQLSTNATIRARGIVAQGEDDGASSSVESSIGPVAVTQQPLGLTNNAGATASFRVQGTGGSVYTYQWTMNGNALTNIGNVYGSQTDTLTISNVLATNEGFYQVILTDSSISVTSAIAHLFVIDPVITNQPSGGYVSIGQTATLSVAAVGTLPIYYQWLKNGIPLSGATNASFSLTNLQSSDGGNYDVLVSNLFGNVTSSVAPLFVLLTPPDSFNPMANAEVQALAVQPDGRIVAGGKFTSFFLGMYSRSHIAQFLTNGTLDPNFSISITGGTSPTVSSISIQPDGKLLVGGSFTSLGGLLRTNIGRIYTNATVDSTFGSSAVGGAGALVSSLALQTNGAILVGGWFTNLGGIYCQNIGRLNPNGSIDASFNPGANGANPGVCSICVEPNGKILVAGSFTNLGGQMSSNVGQLNPDGSFDSTFNPGANKSVHCCAIQADGKILVAGDFTTLAGTTCNRLGRLNADGTLDTNFSASASGSVLSLALQTDGKIIVGGVFTNLDNQSCNFLGRLNSDGSLDPSFNSFTSSSVDSLTIQPDGRILVTGTFFALCGQYIPCLGRLVNNGTSSQSFSFDGFGLKWLRSGTGPELLSTSFETSTNKGTNWLSIGYGTRLPGGWRSPNLVSAATNTVCRVRGFVTGGYQSGSSWFVQNQYTLDPNAPPTILGNGNTFEVMTNGFGFNVLGLVGQMIIVEASTNLATWIPVQTNALGIIPLSFDDPSAGSFPQRFYRARLQ